MYSSTDYVEGLTELMNCIKITLDLSVSCSSKAFQYICSHYLTHSNPTTTLFSGQVDPIYSYSR